MDSAPVHLVVDDREKAGGKVPAALAARGDVTVEIARLDVGDYRVERSLGCTAQICASPVSP